MNSALDFIIVLLFRTMSNWLLEFEKWAPSIISICFKVCFLSPIGDNSLLGIVPLRCRAFGNCKICYSNTAHLRNSFLKTFF